jgi:hypothetical protein
MEHVFHRRAVSRMQPSMGLDLLPSMPRLVPARRLVRAWTKAEYLLTELGWLRFDRTLDVGAHRLGLTMMAGAHLGRIDLARNADPRRGQTDHI